MGEQTVGEVRRRALVERARKGEPVGLEAEHLGPIQLVVRGDQALEGFRKQAVVVAEQQHVLAAGAVQSGGPVIGDGQRLILAQDSQPRVCREAGQNLLCVVLARIVRYDELELIHIG